ncbi:MAG: GNAT family N-acetyltransferase [Chloroflexi bacterium]|nr:GNAT family N-acetyltransferase [Chloroflexota bacterium]
MPNTPIIRPLTAGDIPLVAEWIAAIPLWQRYHMSAERGAVLFAQALHRADVLLAAEVDGVAHGVAWCMVGGAFGRSGYLRLLGVHPAEAGYGLGARLLEQAEHVIARTSPDMFLLVSDFNAGAQRFYARQGYQQVGALPAYVLPDVTELIFWKRLDPV